MIFKTIWANRKQNGFVFAEIILIAVLSFFLIDVCTVSIYDTYICKPSNDFERKHLVVGQTIQMPGEVPDSIESLFANLYAFRDQVRALPEVQYAALTANFVGEDGGLMWNKRMLAPEADTTRHCKALGLQFLLHEQFFETQGLTPVQGSPSAAVLSDKCPEDGIVITRSMALALFGTDQVVGRRIVSMETKYENNGIPKCEIEGRYAIAGVMEDFRALYCDRYCYSFLTPVTSLFDTDPRILIRLRPEADADAFVSKYMEQPLFSKGDGKGNESRGENCQMDWLKTYTDYFNQFSRDGAGYVFFGILFAILLLNVMLGTLGTYWLQLRRRTEDIGIMRSFGARRRDIFFMVWAEAALLSFVACIIGQVIWLQVALKQGLFRCDYNDGTGEEVVWVTQFWPHFFIIGTIQYLIILIIVTLGIVVPATHAMYKKPVDALRHE